jgi:hypothetical protein
MGKSAHVLRPVAQGTEHVTTSSRLDENADCLRSYEFRDDGDWLRALVDVTIAVRPSQS